jgi:hypothetical protein
MSNGVTYRRSLLPETIWKELNVTIGDVGAQSGLSVGQTGVLTPHVDGFTITMPVPWGACAWLVWHCPTDSGCGEHEPEEQSSGAAEKNGAENLGISPETDENEGGELLYGDTDG